MPLVTEAVIVHPVLPEATRTKQEQTIVHPAATNLDSLLCKKDLNQKKNVSERLLNP